MRPVHDLSTPISARIDSRHRFSRSTPSGARSEVMGARRTYERASQVRPVPIKNPPTRSRHGLNARSIDPLAREWGTYSDLGTGAGVGAALGVIENEEERDEQRLLQLLERGIERCVADSTQGARCRCERRVSNGWVRDRKDQEMMAVRADWRTYLAQSL